VRAGRQVICETHSEYLVNRLRIQLGEKQISYPQDVRVYFAQRRAGASSFAEVEFDDRGRIRNWPDGFFDQSAIDSARLLQLDLSD
jgi:predicted ATPase